MRDASAELLDWYDAHARVMPWRVGPLDRQTGQRPDPYRVWLSEIMLQQTTVAAVRAYYLRFTERWPTVCDLAAADDAAVMAEWAGLGYYARARNLLKCARKVVADHDGVFPDAHDALLALPGIGPYTAAAISAIAFDRSETVVDGNVERVIARLHAVETPLPAAKRELTELAARLTPKERPGDYAQAVMDLGATICTPKSPACGLCPLIQRCAGRAAGIAPDLPRKTPKPPKPTRYGIAYIGQRTDGAWLLERRPDTGLLGGMLGWPGSDWSDAPGEDPPALGQWRDPGAEVRHTFTHFHLRLALRVAVLDQDSRPTAGQFVARHNFRPSDLPTVMRKAFDLASASFANIER
ncbi:MAG: A/G-specific adenine glycosylase [Pseudomonadota bacterium]